MKFYIEKVLILILTFNSITAAGGLDYNTTYGSRTFSLNGLYFAGSPGLSSINSNPAGLAGLNGMGIELSIMNRIENNEYDSPSRGLHKSFRGDKYTFGGGVFWQLSDNFNAALSYHPVIDYKADWPFAYLRSTDTSSSVLAFSMMNHLQVMSISPAVSFRLGALTIGVAANVYQIINQINFPRNNYEWGQNEGLAAYQFQYDMDTWAYGGTLGLHYDLNDQVKIGLAVRSGIAADLEGNAESRMFADLYGAAERVDAAAEFQIPWRFGLGLLYLLNQSTAINIDAAYSLWGNNVSHMNFSFNDPVWQERTSAVDSLSGFSGNSIPLEFNNSVDLGLGLEHYTRSGMIYRAGYRFSQSMNSESSYSFLFPVTDQHIVSVGIGYKDERLSIDAGFAYSFGITKAVPPGENRFLYGEYFTDSYMPSVSLRYEF